MKWIWNYSLMFLAIVQVFPICWSALQTFIALGRLIRLTTLRLECGGGTTDLGLGVALIGLSWWAHRSIRTASYGSLHYFYINAVKIILDVHVTISLSLLLSLSLVKGQFLVVVMPLPCSLEHLELIRYRIAENLVPSLRLLNSLKTFSVWPESQETVSEVMVAFCLLQKSCDGDGLISFVSTIRVSSAVAS